MDEITGFSLRFMNLKTGLNTPVTTVDRTITEKNGQSSQPSIKQDMVKTPRKNHKIILREFLSSTMPPQKNTTTQHAYVQQELVVAK